MLGGDPRVDSSLGAGTRVELKVPIDGGYSALAKGIVSRRPIREPPSRCEISTDMLIDFSVWASRSFCSRRSRVSQCISFQNSRLRSVPR